MHLRDLLDIKADLVATDHSADHGVLAVEVGARHVADEKLGAVRVWARVGHRDQTLVRVLYPDPLVSELGSVDALVPLAVGSHDFTSLHHELGNDSLDLSALVKEVLAHLSSAEGPEVLDRLGQQVLEQLNDNSLLFVALFARLLDLNVHPGLDMVWRERRHRRKLG